MASPDHPRIGSHAPVLNLRSRLQQLVASATKMRTCRRIILSEDDWRSAVLLPTQGACGVVKRHRLDGDDIILKRSYREADTLHEMEMHRWIWERLPEKVLKYISEPVEIKGMVNQTSAQLYVPNSLTLHSFMTRGPTDDMKLCIAHEIASAWAHMHVLGVAHMDFHAGNVLYNLQEQHIVIVDFGHMEFLKNRHFVTSADHHNDYALARTGSSSQHMQEMYGPYGLLPNTLARYNQLHADLERTHSHTARRRYKRFLAAVLAMNMFAFFTMTGFLCAHISQIYNR